MYASVIINTHEIGEYIPEGGVQVSNVERSSKEIITMSGTKYRKSITKKQLTINLLDNMIDSAFTTIAGYIGNTGSVSLSYSNFETGSTFSGTFLVTSPLSYTIQRSRTSTLTTISGGTFTLEEQ